MIQFQKGTFADQSVNFAVVCWSPSSSSANFVNYILDIVKEYNIKILLGDFNINAFHDTLLNKTTLQRFQIVATEATRRLCKGLIDHVYLRKKFYGKQTSVKFHEKYLLHHDAFKCKIYLSGSKISIEFSVFESIQK